MAIPNLRPAGGHTGFENVFWIGGATDSGKTTIANALAATYDLKVYHYDDAELAHLSRLAEGGSAFRKLMNATMDERWVDAEPGELFDRVNASFYERWPLVLDDLRAFGATPVIAEGFGLMPDLVATVARRTRAVFLVPDEALKAMSVARRDKPYGRLLTRDPERARSNVLERDAQIAAEVRTQAVRRGLLVLEATVRQDADSLGRRVARWFRL